ncbi:MAG: amidase [Gammaproteobacteria bacterium]
MTDSDLAYMDIAELGMRFARRELSPVEVTRAMLARIETVDRRLGSYVTMMADSALREARAADTAYARGGVRGPLLGVPLAVKDLCDASGVPTIAGMPRIRTNAVATRDATVVARLRAAGAVILGKLQLTEGAVAIHHPDVRVPVNPHHAERWSGASSSGTGAAVAAGLAYGGLGSDTGGSIRFPSFANGVTGLKPTWGRVSRAGVFPLSASLDHVGPMARSSACCAAVLGAIAGADRDDPTSLADPVPDYFNALGGSIADLRIGYDADYAEAGVHATLVAAQRAALDVFNALGARIVPCRMPDTTAVIDAWFALATADAAAAHFDTYPARAADFGPGLAGLLDSGRAASAVDYARAHECRLAFRGALGRVFDQVDLVLAPAMMRTNFTLAEFRNFGSQASDWPELVRFTAPFDVSGTPTLSLPAGFEADGAPFGFQLLGPFLGERALLRAGHAWQAVTDWHRRRPAQVQEG